MTLHLITPTIDSTALSREYGLDIHLKLENTQPCGSFKLRGIGHACQTLHRQGARRFLSSSGGNAGYAVAYAGRKLGLPVTVVVPETTSERAKTLIRSEDAEVIVHGATWQECNAHAQSLRDATTAFIHPFDDPLLWEGHASMIDELATQGPRPDVVVCSVGGGGLLAGVAQGLQRNGWQDVGILAVETAGAASLAAALKQGAPVALPAIDSIATSLGARQVCQRAFEVASGPTLRSHVLSDASAVDGCATLLQAHRLLTEPACGASIAALAEVRRYFPQARRAVAIVCGGVGITVEQMQQWQATLSR